MSRKSKKNTVEKAKDSLDSDLKPKERAFAMRLRQLADGGKKLRITLTDGLVIDDFTFITVEPNGMFTCVRQQGSRGSATLTDYHVSDIRSITTQ